MYICSFRLHLWRVGTLRCNVWIDSRREMGGRLLPFATHYCFKSNNPETQIVAIKTHREKIRRCCIIECKKHCEVLLREEVNELTMPFSEEEFQSLETSSWGTRPRMDLRDWRECVALGRLRRQQARSPRRSSISRVMSSIRNATHLDKSARVLRWGSFAVSLSADGICSATLSAVDEETGRVVLVVEPARI